MEIEYGGTEVNKSRVLKGNLERTVVKGALSDGTGWCQKVDACQDVRGL